MLAAASTMKDNAASASLHLQEGINAADKDRIVAIDFRFLADPSRVVILVREPKSVAAAAAAG